LSEGVKPAGIVMLLGRPDAPTDALEDYCNFLGRALERAGQPNEIQRVPWAERGWLAGLGWLWRESRAWRGRWVLVQYTALVWSRRGISLPVLAVLWILRFRGARVAIVFHDAVPYGGGRWVDRIRRAVQIWVMRREYGWADCSIMTVPVASVAWLPSSRRKAAFVPVSANLSGTCTPSKNCAPRSEVGRGARKTVAIYGVTGAPGLHRDVEVIAHAVRRAAGLVPNLRLLVIGRHAEDAAASLHAALAGTQVEVEFHGVLPADEVERRLSEADTLLFVRGGISSRRGSALAGIVCGLPVVAFQGPETGPPVTEAGVLLAKEGDRDALGDALARVLNDDALRAELSARSFAARDKYFSWNVIGANLLQVLRSA
jgi:glycosyltransferase involved in cell wall biosynthesis